MINSKCIFIYFFIMIIGCDSNNINKSLADSSNKESYSYKLKEAQSAYDKKDFSKSLDIVNELISIHGETEELVLYKSYSTFGLSGFDPVDLARRFYGAWQFKNDPDLTHTERFILAVEYIGQLTNDEFYGFYTTAANINGFDTSLRVPIEDAHSEVDTTRIAYIFSAARLLCNQIDNFAQYFDWGCTPETKERINFESHLLWARIHFAESILLTNAIVRSLTIGRNSLIKQLKNSSNITPSLYLDLMGRARVYLAEVFPTDNSNTMIKYIVYDWLTVINSYNLIGRTKSKLAQIFALLQEAVQLKWKNYLIPILT